MADYMAPGRVSVQGVESLRDDCRFIPADWGSCPPSDLTLAPGQKIVKARILKIPLIFQDFLNPRREPTSSLAVYPGLVLTSMALEVSSLLQPVQLKWYGWYTSPLNLSGSPSITDLKFENEI